MLPQPAGYSGTLLIKKLGIKPGVTIVALKAPPHYKQLLGTLPDGAKLSTRLGKSAAFVHLFSDTQAVLTKQIPGICQALAKDGMLWVSWPKKSSRVSTDITEDVLRKLILPTGLVDVKVCAVDDVWSGLKFVWRVENR